jgi:hypothetical protein
MTKQKMLDYAAKMDDDEEVFVIVYSKADVVAWFKEQNHETLVPPDEDISDALRRWEDGMDMSCPINFADALDDLCQELLDKEIKRTQ